MNQRKILQSQQNATPNGEGSTALPVSLNIYSDPKRNRNFGSPGVALKNTGFGVGGAYAHANPKSGHL
jgi:hypothetical protein